MKNITNQEIMNIVESNDATNRENYNDVKWVENKAKDSTELKVKKTIHHWNQSDYKIFCNEVRTLLRNN